MSTSASTDLESESPMPTNASLPKSATKRLVLGGCAGILADITYIVGFVLFGLELSDLFDDANRLEAVQFLSDHRTIFYLANGLVYILNGFLQIIVACTVYEYLQQQQTNRN